MMLLIETEKDRVVVGALDRKGNTWISRKGRNMFGALMAMQRKVEWRKPTHIVVVERVGLEVDAQPTWSQIRGMSVVANTLAFAYGIPVRTLRIAHDTDKKTVVAAAVALVHDGTLQAGWSTPHYNAEPNITTPRPPV